MKKVWIIDLDAVRCEWIKKSISHAVKVTHIIIFTFFGTKYIMQWNIGHINKIFSSSEKVKLILIYCPVHFQQLFIFLMPFYDLAKFILKFWHSSWYTPMEFRLEFGGRWTLFRFRIQTNLWMWDRQCSLWTHCMWRRIICSQGLFDRQWMPLQNAGKQLEGRDRRSQVSIKAPPLLKASDVLKSISANDNWKWNPTSRGWE